MKVSLNDKTSASTGPDLFEKLELSTDEVARLIIPVDDADRVYVHTLEAPVVSGGEVKMETKTRKDKSTYEVIATSFVGRRQCLGDPDVMKAHGGIDEDNCPMCAAAKELGVPELIPEPRFALPVIRVTCTSKTSSEPQDPPGAKIYVLTLTAKQYSGLVSNFDSIRELYDWGPEHPVKPNQADIILKCEDGDWKRYLWEAPKRRSWSEQKNPELNSLIKRLWGNVANRPTDEQLEAAIARPADRKWVEIDLAKVTDAWAEVRSIQRGETGERHRQQPAETAGANVDAEADLASALDDLDSLDDIGGLLGEPEAGTAGTGDPDLAGLDEFAPGTTSNPGPNGNGNGKAPAAEPDAGPGAADVPEDIAREAAGAPAADEEMFGDPEPAAPAKAEPAAPAKAAKPAAPPAAEEAGDFDSILDGL
jgi:hypothetical protein